MYPGFIRTWIMWTLVCLLEFGRLSRTLHSPSALVIALPSPTPQHQEFPTLSHHTGDLAALSDLCSSASTTNCITLINLSLWINHPKNSLLKTNFLLSVCSHCSFCLQQGLLKSSCKLHLNSTLISAQCTPYCSL